MKEFVSGVFIGGVVVALVMGAVFLADIRQRNRDREEWEDQFVGWIAGMKLTELRLMIQMFQQRYGNLKPSEVVTQLNNGRIKPCVEQTERSL